MKISPFIFSKGPVEVPGCLASKDKSLMNILIMKKQKEVLNTVNKMLVDMLATKESSRLKENLKSRLATRISAHSLQKFVHQFKGVDDLRAILEPSKKLQVRVFIIYRREIT